jgi:4-amino-4-deoxy-L-arabinose transferase-like glycosyltransferase
MTMPSVNTSRTWDILSDHGTVGRMNGNSLAAKLRQRPLLLIFLLGLVLRLGFLGAAELTGNLEIAEGAIFRDLAQNILDGRGMSISPHLLEVRPGAPEHVLDLQRRWIESGGLFGMIPPGEPTAFFMPLYPIFLAGIFAVFGSGFLPAQLVQLLLSALLPLIAYHLARRAVGRETALAAALLAAIHPYFIYYAGLLVTQTLFVVLLGLSSNAYYALRRRPTVWRAVLLGLLLGLSFLTRTFTATFLPLLLLALIIELGFPRWFPGTGGAGRGSGNQLARAVVLALVTSLAFTAVATPWVIRNFILFDELVILPTKGGRNLWEYNNQKFSTEFDTAENEWTRERYREIRRSEMPTLQRKETVEFPVFDPGLPETERNRILTRNVKTFILANPRVYLRLCLVRASEMIRVTPVRKTNLLFKVVAWMSIGWQLPLALVGMVMLARRWRHGPFYLFLLTIFYLSLHALVAAGTPHRVQVDLYMLVFCAHPLAWLARRMFSGPAGAGGGE